MTLPLGEALDWSLNLRRRKEMLKFEIDDLHCMSCVNSIKDAIQEQDAEAEVDGNIEKSEVYVKSTIEENRIEEIILEAGYELSR